MELSTAPAPQGQYTILRIKRKRNEEPLDALVVESRIRRKKSKGGVGVFQYAQTVESSAWDDEKSQKDIQDTISKLSREIAVQSESGAEVRQHSPIAAKQASPSRKRRYTIIEVDQGLSPTKQKLDPISQTATSRDVDPPVPAPDFRMYDAILSPPTIQEPEEEEDPEMVKFQAMLSDYLRVNDVQLSPPPSESPLKVPVASKNDSRMKPPTADDGDYVWDIFYHRPTSLSEWNDLANVGMLSSFPTALFDEDYDSESESEIEDEADEDSNEEDYYKNDYPDEETDSEVENSDEWHEDSDYEDTTRFDAEFNF